MNQKDMYDIIIENITKDWYSSMSGNLKPTKWEIPKYSKKQINNAGKIISDMSLTFGDRRQVLDIINNWRASHAYPLQIITNNLRKNNPNAIVVQRLKRLDSIIGKLERFPNMDLYRMEDLGGCRVIVDSIEDVYKTVDKYKCSRIRHQLIRERDYIQDPKDSGYRSYHTVYKFHSDTKETYNQNMRLEIQFRTKLQHMWATALETMGIYTKTALKASMGDKNILRFFVLVSSVFAKMENTPVCPNTSDNYNVLINEIRIIDNKLNIVSRLSALSVAIRHTNEKYSKGKGYYFLRLDFDKKLLNVRSYSQSQIELATKAYDAIESFNNPKIDSVLVSATSLETLKTAYPNYFTDVTEFVDMMRRILA